MTQDLIENPRSMTPDDAAAVIRKACLHVFERISGALSGDGVGPLLDALTEAREGIAAVVDQAPERVREPARRLIEKLDAAKPLNVSHLAWEIDTVRDALDGIRPRPPIFDDLHIAQTLATARASRGPTDPTSN